MDRQHESLTLLRSWPVLLLLGVFLAAGLSRVHAAGSLGTGPVSGLAVPRFVSIKKGPVNVRRGPNIDTDVTWVYTRAGLPIEITAEYGNWRRIRDWEGGEGWVYHSLLSGNRTALVTAKVKTSTELIPIYAEADPHGDVTARLQPGVLGAVKRCTDSWCRIAGNGFDGWIPQQRLWGVYPNENVD
jgi:SH3-like domain-containing protein